MLCRNNLVANGFALLGSLAKLAYRSDDVDFPGLVVGLLSEKELLEFLESEVKTSRGSETNFRSDGLDTALISKWAQV
jgi:hypothetical protein